MTQAAGITCTFTVAPTSLFLSGSGGSETVSVTPNNEACPWTASSGIPWLSVTPSSGTGTDNVSVVASANSTGLPREGSVTIAGQTVTVTQSDVAGCGFIVSPSSFVLDSAGGTKSVTITATSSTCEWGLSSDAWITSTAYHGTGSGSLTLTVGTNDTGVARLGALALSGEPIAIRQTATQQVFTDVPPEASFFDAVNLLFANSVTQGCAAGLYCPETPLTRAEMAVFLVRSFYGGDTFDFSPTPYFTDVPADAFGFQFIQKLKELGLTTGCGPTTFCPDTTMTRDTAAVFVIRGRYGATAAVTNPAAPYFTDVPESFWAFAEIQRLKADRITDGCGPSVFCPAGLVTRGDVAVFLMRGLFNKLLPSLMPVVTAVAPSVVTQGQTIDLTVTGQNTSFSQGASIVADIPGVAINSVTVNSPTLLTVSVTVDAAAPQQPQTVRVLTGTEDVVLPFGLSVQ